MNLKSKRKNTFRKGGIFTMITFFIALQSSIAQSPSDALMMQKSEICIAALYQHDTWHQYWEGKLLRENLNIGTLTRKTVMPMLAYGLSERLNVFASLPYISTAASGGQLAGVSGWQDLGIFAKYKFYDAHAIQLFASAGYSFPVTNYLSDYMPLNLGLSTDEISIRCIAKYETKSKIYLRASGAYVHRTTTEAERDYYYYDNNSYYTTTMDVPSVITVDGAIGAWLFEKQFQLEVNAVVQNGLSGDDIRRQNSPQPTNKMNTTNVGAYLRYFPTFLSGWSIIGNYAQVLEGRNVGKSQILSCGITYQFQTKSSTSKTSNP